MPAQLLIPFLLKMSNCGTAPLDYNRSCPTQHSSTRQHSSPSPFPHKKWYTQRMHWSRPNLSRKFLPSPKCCAAHSLSPLPTRHRHHLLLLLWPQPPPLTHLTHHQSPPSSLPCLTQFCSRGHRNLGQSAPGHRCHSPPQRKHCWRKNKTTGPVEIRRHAPLSPPPSPSLNARLLYDHARRWELQSPSSVHIRLIVVLSFIQPILPSHTKIYYYIIIYIYIYIYICI